MHLSFASCVLHVQSSLTPFSNHNSGERTVFSTRAVRFKKSPLPPPMNMILSTRLVRLSSLSLSLCWPYLCYLYHILRGISTKILSACVFLLSFVLVTCPAHCNCITVLNEQYVTCKPNKFIIPWLFRIVLLLAINILRHNFHYFNFILFL